MRYRAAPCLDALAGPIPVTALLLLLVNDHVLKATHPGWWSGKLSDVAVLVLLPFLLLALRDVAVVVRLHARPAGVMSAVAAAAIAIGLFTVIELTAIGAELYRWGLGLAQWPVRSGLAAMGGDRIPAVAPVALTSDPSDLLTLPFGLIVLIARPWIETGKAASRAPSARVSVWRAR